MRFVSFFVCIMLALTMKAAVSADSVASAVPAEACFSVGKPKGDASAVETLLQKTRAIIGRVGCGAEHAAFEIVPCLVVDETKSTSTTLRKITVAKGTLILEAVSADNPEIVWHSVEIPLKATLSGSEESPAEALAKQIAVSDSRFVRFVRVARKKIAEAAGSH